MCFLVLGDAFPLSPYHVSYYRRDSKKREANKWNSYWLLGNCKMNKNIFPVVRLACYWALAA